jgi:hypothetical protein
MATQCELELMIPDYWSSAKKPPWIPLRSASLGPDVGDWWFDDGALHWSINGVKLLDGSFALYPGNQIEALLDIIDLSLCREKAEVNIGGSVLYLTTRPMAGHQTKFGLRIPGRRTSSGKDELTEVAASLREVARSVTRTVRAWMEHIPHLPPARPTTANEPSRRDACVEMILQQLEPIEERLRRLR